MFYSRGVNIKSSIFLVALLSTTVHAQRYFTYSDFNFSDNSTDTAIKKQIDSLFDLHLSREDTKCSSKISYQRSKIEKGWWTNEIGLYLEPVVSVNSIEYKIRFVKLDFTEAFLTSRNMTRLEDDTLAISHTLLYGNAMYGYVYKASCTGEVPRD